MNALSNVAVHSRSRARRARREPLRAKPHAPGMVTVERLGAGDDGNHEYVVDLRGGACECPDYQYTMGPIDAECKHLAFMRLVSAGDLCPSCGYAQCRPSCVRRSDSR
jgi:hypothetical protein